MVVREFKQVAVITIFYDAQRRQNLGDEREKREKDDLERNLSSL